MIPELKQGKLTSLFMVEGVKAKKVADSPEYKETNMNLCEQK
jgi:hypothetical protein